MKKALLLLLALCVLTLAACRKQQPSPTETAPETVTETAPTDDLESIIGYEEVITPEE